MSAGAGSTTLINQLLASAHNALPLQQAMCRSFTRQGVASNALPNQDTLIAFAFLADHGRVQVESDLECHWQELTLRGLAHGATSDYSTPCLRVLLMVAPACLGLADLRTRMGTDAAHRASPEIFRCASKVTDLIWGQRVRLDYHLEDADYLLITPASIFARQPLLLHAGGEIVRGSIELPGDDGEVVFTMLGRNGELYRHTTAFKLRDTGRSQRGQA